MGCHKRARQRRPEELTHLLFEHLYLLLFGLEDGGVSQKSFFRLVASKTINIVVCACVWICACETCDCWISLRRDKGCGCRLSRTASSPRVRALCCSERFRLRSSKTRPCCCSTYGGGGAEQRAGQRADQLPALGGPHLCFSLSQAALHLRQPLSELLPLPAEAMAVLLRSSEPHLHVCQLLQQKPVLWRMFDSSAADSRLFLLTIHHGFDKAENRLCYVALVMKYIAFMLSFAETVAMVTRN